MIIVNKETGEVIDKFTPPNRLENTESQTSLSSFKLKTKDRPSDRELTAFEALFSENEND